MFLEQIFGHNWTEKVVEVFSDSRNAWFREDADEVEESLILSNAPELIAAGQWLWRIPNPPTLPTEVCPKLAIAMGQNVEIRLNGRARDPSSSSCFIFCCQPESV